MEIYAKLKMGKSVLAILKISDTFYIHPHILCYIPTSNSQTTLQKKPKTLYVQQLSHNLPSPQ